MRMISYVAALGILVGSGFIGGLWSGRWKSSDALTDRVARIEQIPMTVGDWSGLSQSLDPRMIKVAEISGYLLRRYENRRGEVLTVLLVCGRPGPISVHTPDVCYGGIGYEPSSGGQRRLSIDGEGGGRHDELWRLDMARSGVTAQEHLRILYGWSADGRWKAVEDPRVDFAGESSLCKLYIVRSTTGVNDPISGDPAVQFAGQFLPVLRRTLFAPSGS